jgi:hypothetical protein
MPETTRFVDEEVWEAMTPVEVAPVVVSPPLNVI